MGKLRLRSGTFARGLALFTLAGPGAAPDRSCRRRSRYPERSIAGVQFAPRTLVAFGRVRLSAGARKTVTLHVPLRRLQYWSVAAGDWATAAGRRTVSVGALSRDLRLAQAID